MMQKKLRSNLLAMGFALVVGLFLCEGAVRIVTTTDPDGQVYFRNRPLLPYRFPSETVRLKIEEYERKKAEAYVVDDPLLGWTIGPRRKSQNGLYSSNSIGIRSEPREYDPLPPAGTLRIALFGDSFTHGDEEPFPKSWGKMLQDMLNAGGVTAEVVNFGVPGYAIDQAYLRWRYLGREFHPAIAVFGFQAENMKRTVNIFRQMYSRRTWLVFTKPRFVLSPAGDLELVNSPVIPPGRVAEVMQGLDRSPLARYEYWYNPKNYSSSPLFKSRLVSFLFSLFAEAEPDCREETGFWEPENEPSRVTTAILRRFIREVRESGAIPVIVHLPLKGDLDLLAAGKTPSHYRILRELEKEGATVVDPAGKMAGERRLFKHSHYSSKGGRIVAAALDEAIRKLL